MDGEGNDCALFGPDATMSLRVRVRAHRSGSFALIPAATLYRADGILVSNHAGIPLEADSRRRRDVRAAARVRSAAARRRTLHVLCRAYRRLSRHDSEVYDLIDRSYEFEVAGNREFDDGAAASRPSGPSLRNRSVPTRPQADAAALDPPPGGRAPQPCPERPRAHPRAAAILCPPRRRVRPAWSAPQPSTPVGRLRRRRRPLHDLRPLRRPTSLCGFGAARSTSAVSRSSSSRTSTAKSMRSRHGCASWESTYSSARFP